MMDYKESITLPVQHRPSTHWAPQCPRVIIPQHFVLLGDFDPGFWNDLFRSTTTANSYCIEQTIEMGKSTYSGSARQLCSCSLCSGGCWAARRSPPSGRKFATPRICPACCQGFKGWKRRARQMVHRQPRPSLQLLALNSNGLAGSVPLGGPVC